MSSFSPLKNTQPNIKDPALSQKVNINRSKQRWLLIRTRILMLLKFGSAAILLIVAMLFVFSELMLTKPFPAKKGGVAFKYLIENQVKNIPVFKPNPATVEYFFQIGGLESLPENVVEYHSMGDVEEILSYYQLYFQLDFQTQGYRIIEDEIFADSYSITSVNYEGYNVFVFDKGTYRKVIIEYDMTKSV